MAKQWSKSEFVYTNELLFSVETIIICLITQEAMTWIGCLKYNLCRNSSVITFNTAGIDFSMTALFVTVFVEQWLTTKNHLPAIAGLLCSIGCLFIFGADNFLIPTMIAITIVLSLCKNVMDTEGGAENE